MNGVAVIYQGLTESAEQEEVTIPDPFEGLIRGLYFLCNKALNSTNRSIYGMFSLMAAR
jgi:hypothetical protein